MQVFLGKSCLLAGFQPKSPSQPSDDDSWLVGQPEDKTIVLTVDEQVYALDFNNTASYILDALALAGISTQSVKKLRFSSSVQNACMFVSSGFDALEEIRFSDETTLLLCLPTATTSGYFNYGLCAGMPALKKVVFPASLYSCRAIFADCPNCTEILFNGRTQADIESMNGYPFGVDSSILKPGI